MTGRHRRRRWYLAILFILIVEAVALLGAAGLISYVFLRTYIGD